VRLNIFVDHLIHGLRADRQGRKRRHTHQNQRSACPRKTIPSPNAQPRSGDRRATLAIPAHNFS
jgi:hypothetical protein